MLDENVYIFALASEGSTDAEHLVAAKFVRCLQLQHRWVISSAVLSQYKHHFGTRRLPKGGVASELMVSLDDVLHDAARHVWLHNPAVIPGSYEDRDQHMVSAAAEASQSVLVTSDVPLTLSIKADQLDAMKDFSVVNPREALRVLCE